ncbi:unnamed protein product [Caretta caretta]
MGLHPDKGECGNVIWVVVAPDVHQGVVFDYLPEDVRSGWALLGPRVLPLLKGGVKVPSQDQALMRIQGAEEGGCLLIKLQPLRARCQGIDVNEVDHEPLHADLEVQQAAWHTSGRRSGKNRVTTPAVQTVRWLK